jgi:hypothetical protein
MDVNEEEIKKDIEDELKREEMRDKKRRIYIKISGNTSLFTFIMSSSFLINFAYTNYITGGVIGINQTRVYALIILVFVSLVFSIESFIWLNRSKMLQVKNKKNQ